MNVANTAFESDDQQFVENVSVEHKDEAEGSTAETAAANIENLVV